MPRCFSISIQSEVAWRRLLRAFTVPASWIAPENSSSFSVRVVLPASGWAMMPKVRRRAISRATRSAGARAASAAAVWGVTRSTTAAMDRGWRKGRQSTGSRRRSPSPPRHSVPSRRPRHCPGGRAARDILPPSETVLPLAYASAIRRMRQTGANFRYAQPHATPASHHAAVGTRPDRRHRAVRADRPAPACGRLLSARSGAAQARGARHRPGAKRLRRIRQALRGRAQALRHRRRAQAHAGLVAEPAPAARRRADRGPGFRARRFERRRARR